jgi:hypothetical protein
MTDQLTDRIKANEVLSNALRDRGDFELAILAEHIARALAEVRAEERKRIVRWLRQNEGGPYERLAAAIEQDKMQE